MDEKISTVSLLEKVTTAINTASAAHGRVDKLENMIIAQLKDVSTELKEVVAYMNRSKGWAAASLVLSGALGGIAATLIGFMLKH